MHEFHFRLADPFDAGRVAALHAASWRSAYRGILPDAYLDREMDAERRALWQARLGAAAGGRLCVWLAERGNDLAGFACLLLDEEPAWGACLDNLHVQPELRSRGLGRQLFAHAVRWLLAAEPSRPVYLWVFEANAVARRLYERLHGQVAEPAIKDLPGGARVPSLRYVWPDAAALLARLEGRRELENGGENA